VSDGKASAALSAFSVTVALPPTRTATLRWTAPTQNVDGTALTNLASYQVSYGNASKTYCATLSATAAATGVVIEGLEPGTWYFAVKAVNAAGKVSEFSNEAAKVL
jgi:predicted phage tail protein